MKNFLCFRTMITPALIQIIFWISVIFSVFAAAYVIFANHDISIGLQILIFGPLLTRMLCEMMIVIFRINDNLKKISDQLANPKQ